MKRVNYLAMLLMITIFSIGFVACSSDDEKEKIENPVNPPNGGNNSGGGDYTEAQIKQLIKDNVSVSGYYSDFTWYFHIESSLHEKLKDKTIEYAVGHGDVYGEVIYSIEENAYKFTFKYSNGKRVMDFKNPFFFYYVFGEGSTKYNSEDIIGECYFCYTSYEALIEKGVNKLNNGEKDLYNSIIDIFKKYENKSYSPSLGVFIDNKLYTVKEF